MPFTFSHVAAVLPLLGRRRLPLDGTCLVIGAMAPDLEYFVRGSMAGGWGHTPLGLLGWCLPITLLTALLWHRVGKWPLLWIAPARMTSRLLPELAPAWPRTAGASGLLIVAASALLGALTHVGWDGVTHSNGWVVRRVPGMDGLIELPVIGELALPRVLQHGSTVLGLVIVAIWLWRRRWPAPAQVPDLDPAARGDRRRARGWLAVAVVLGVTALIAWNVVRAGLGVPSIGDLVVAIIAGTSWGTLGFALAHRRAAARVELSVEPSGPSAAWPGPPAPP